MNKLLEFQKKVGALKKDSINPYYQSKYTDINGLLDVVKPLLNELELICVQPLDVIDGKNVLRTIIYDSKIIDDGKAILESVIILPDNLDPQKIGSAITYYRRYSLQSLLLLEAEDDDANSTQPRKPLTTSKGAKYKESVYAKTKSFDKDEIGKLLLECEVIDDVTKLWWLLTKEQQENKEIHGWFSIRKEQING